MLENAIIMSRRHISMAVPFSWHSVLLKWQDESCSLSKFLFSVRGRGKRASLDTVQIFSGKLGVRNAGFWFQKTDWRGLVIK